MDIFGFPCGRAALDLRGLSRDRFAFFGAVVVRADFFLSTSAETSSVQRTRRPVLCDGILMALFDTAISLDSGDGNSRTARFRRQITESRSGQLQDGQSAFKPVSLLSHFGSVWHAHLREMFRAMLSA